MKDRYTTRHVILNMVGIVLGVGIALDEYFISKKKMAQTLDVSLRTLQYNFKRIKLKKGGCMALTNLLLYCYENEISVDQIYRRYQNLDRSSIKGDGKMSHSGMMKWMYIFASRSTNQYGSSWNSTAMLPSTSHT